MKEDGDIDFARIIKAISNTIEPLKDTTMLTSLNSMLEVSRYTSDGDLALSSLAQKILANYASSFVPASVGALAKTVDPTKRKAYTKSGDPLQIWTSMFEQTQNKIPFLSKNNVPYLNAWGEEETSSHFKAFLDNFILPDKIQKMTDSELDDTLEALSKHVGDSVLPSFKEKSLTVNGETVKLDDQQWYQYGKVKGQESKRVLQELIERPEFICLAPEVQQQLVEKVYKYAKAKGALTVFPDKKITDTWTRDALNANNVVDYIFEKEEEKAKDASVKTHKQSLCKQIQQTNIRAAETDIAYLKQAGVEESTIKSTITGYFKPLYKTAYASGNYDEMGQIRATLQVLGLGYENYNFDNWLK